MHASREAGSLKALFSRFRGARILVRLRPRRTGSISHPDGNVPDDSQARIRASPRALRYR